MNESTDYVHTHVINYEPTYLVLMEAVEDWMADQNGPLAPYRDLLRDAVEQNYESMGLRASDLDDDVDYAAMIEYEMS